MDHEGTLALLLCLAGAPFDAAGAACQVSGAPPLPRLQMHKPQTQLSFICVFTYHERQATHALLHQILQDQEHYHALRFPEGGALC